MSLDNQSLAHTSWNCKYHIVFAPKYRRKEFYGLKRLEIGAILRKLCDFKQITIHEAEVCPDHVHMLVSIPPKMSVSAFKSWMAEPLGIGSLPARLGFLFDVYLAADARLPSRLSVMRPHMKHASSLATAVTALFLSLPERTSRLNFLIILSVALSQYETTHETIVDYVHEDELEEI